MIRTTKEEISHWDDILDEYENLNKLREEIYKNPKVIKWMDQVYSKVI